MVQGLGISSQLHCTLQRRKRTRRQSIRPGVLHLLMEPKEPGERFVFSAELMSPGGSKVIAAVPYAPSPCATGEALRRDVRALRVRGLAPICSKVR
jgi:hypothetical protein